MNHYLTYPDILIPVAIVLGAVIWILLGILTTRAGWGLSEAIPMIHYNYPVLGIAMLVVNVVFWPIVSAILWLLALVGIALQYLEDRKKSLMIRTTPDVRQSLRQLGVDSNSPDIQELFRRAIGTYHFVTDAKKKGMTFYAIDAQGEHHHIDFP